MSVCEPRFDGVGPQLRDRSIFVRGNIGAAGLVIQRAELTSRRITAEHTTLILVKHGLKRVSWPSGECTASAGDAIAIQGGETVDITNAPEPNGEYGAQWISWTSKALTALQPTPAHGKNSVPATLIPSVQAGFRDAYRAAFESLVDLGGIPDQIASHRLQEVLLWMRDRGVSLYPRHEETLHVRVRRLLSSDPSREWTIESVARNERSSIATLRRHLAEENRNFRDLLHDVRMSHALTLLQNTDRPILEIALAVGYDSASRFAARFRSRFGYLPSDVRGQRRSRSHSRDQSANRATQKIADMAGLSIPATF